MPAPPHHVFTLHNLMKSVSKMNRTCFPASFCLKGRRSVECPVNLKYPRPISKALQLPAVQGREPVAGDGHQLTRCKVEHQRMRGRKLIDRPDKKIRLDFPANGHKVRSQCRR